MVDDSGYEGTASGLASLLTDAAAYEPVAPTVVDALEGDLVALESGGTSVTKSTATARTERIAVRVEPEFDLR